MGSYRFEKNNMKYIASATTVYLYTISCWDRIVINDFQIGTRKNSAVGGLTNT